MIYYRRPFTRWLVFSLVCLITLTGFGCRRQSAPRQTAAPVALVMWGLWQDSAVMDPVIKAFRDQTKISVEYKKIASVAEYEKMLLEALAQGRGPDIFVVHHTWVENKRGIMLPAPPDIIDERALKEEFVDVAAADLVRDGLVYALPTSIDTLALYYNKDLLATGAIARPPRTWEEMLSAVGQLTKVTPTGDIQQSAIALGTAANINRVADIAQVLMMQSGLSLTPEDGKPATLMNAAAERALVFYTDFANRAKKSYTWNLEQDYSIDAFAEGDTAMMINYSYHQATIRAKNPRLSFGVAHLPQNTDSKVVNFAAYWPFAVATTSQQPQAAWEFLRFMTNSDMSTLINKAQGAPPARRDSVIESQRDPDLGVFADQTLSAASWPRADITATDTIFNEMIDSVVTGKTTPKDALQRAQDLLQQLQKDNAGT